jgi:hypothetical protein
MKIKIQFPFKIQARIGGTNNTIIEQNINRAKPRYAPFNSLPIRTFTPTCASSNESPANDSSTGIFES